MSGKERRNKNHYCRYTRQYGGYRGSYMVLDMDTSTAKVWRFYDKNPTGTVVEAMKETGFTFSTVTELRASLIAVGALNKSVIGNENDERMMMKRTKEHLDKLAACFVGLKQIKEYRDDE